MSMSIADVVLPLWLVASQWVLLFALGFLVLVMYRQLGYVLNLRTTGNEEAGLPVGDKAPAFDYLLANLGANGSARFEASGSWSLVTFADPTCVSCQDTLFALERLAPRFGPAVRILVFTTADPAMIEAVEAFRTASVDLGRVSKEVPERLYRTNITPFAYLVSPDGSIRAKGVVGDESRIRKILQQGDRSTIQVESARTRG